MSLSSIFQQSELLTRELPMRAMVLGDFGSRAWQAIDVSLQTIDNAVERMAISISVQDLNGLSIDVLPSNIKGFTPLGVVNCSPQLKKVNSAIQSIRKLATNGQLNSTEEKSLKTLVQWDVKNPPTSDVLWVEYNQLKNQLVAAIDLVLSSEEFRRIERSWLSLQSLLQVLANKIDDQDSGESGTIITIVNLSRDDLYEDLNSVSTVSDSVFYQTVYSEELGQFGGVPYHAVCLLHELHNTPGDLTALQLMSACCRSAQAILLCAASDKLLNDSTLSEDALLQARFLQWRALVESINSRQILMSAGHHYYRAPYDYAEIMSGVSYKENVSSPCRAPLHIFHLLGLASSQTKLGTPLLFSEGVNFKEIEISGGQLEIVERFNPEQLYVFRELGINCPQVSSFSIKFEQPTPMRAAIQFLGDKGSVVVDNDASVLMLQQQFSRQMKVLVRETLGHSDPEEVKQLIQDWLGPYSHSGGFVGRSQWLKQPLEAVNVDTLTENGATTLDIFLKLRLPEQSESVDLQLEWAS
jgi:predicted component of type VI protein secretion system